MTLEDQLEGAFGGLLAAPLDLEAIALEVQEVRAAEWVDAEANPSWSVLLRATALLRTPVLQLIERVRLLEQIGDGRLPHRGEGACPGKGTELAARDSTCRACQVPGAPRRS